MAVSPYYDAHKKTELQQETEGREQWRVKIFFLSLPNQIGELVLWTSYTKNSRIGQKDWIMNINEESLDFESRDFDWRKHTRMMDHSQMEDTSVLCGIYEYYSGLGVNQTESDRRHVEFEEEKDGEHETREIELLVSRDTSVWLEHPGSG